VSVDLNEAEQLARLFGSSNCWTGTTGRLASVILSLVEQLKQQTPPEEMQTRLKAAISWTGNLSEMERITYMEREILLGLLKDVSEFIGDRYE
jgi:hypothetical protein